MLGIKNIPKDPPKTIESELKKNFWILWNKYKKNNS